MTTTLTTSNLGIAFAQKPKNAHNRIRIAYKKWPKSQKSQDHSIQALYYMTTNKDSRFMQWILVKV